MQDYEALLDACTPAESWIREPAAIYAAGNRWNERHLQCIWFDRRLRPTALETADREAVEIVDPGRWNLEAGPDFLDAVLKVGQEKRVVTGDIEIHVRPGDWTAHSHATDPRYANVVAHVTYRMPSPASAPEGLPSGCLQIGLRAPLTEMPWFSFDDIDLAAYPFAIQPDTPRPCATALAGDPDRAKALLEIAGRHRFGRKCERMRALLASSDDPAQVFYSEFLAALGYKRNSAACRELASVMPLSSWEDGAPPEKHYARLLGAAGLLPQADAGHDDESRDFIRSLWDAWWHDDSEKPEAPIAWALDATRPMNHPARRLAAAAAFFANHRDPVKFFAGMYSAGPESFAKKSIVFLSGLTMDYWSRHLSLAGARTDRASATIIGRNRAAAIYTNLLAPILVATGAMREPPCTLPPEDVSAPMRIAANHLLGRDHNPATYNNDGLLQHGLLQLFADFCLRAKCGCEGCALPAYLKTTIQ